MGRSRSSRVSDVKAKLAARIRDGFHRPGDPFLSNRGLADRYGVSYQTAHRLLAELVSEGWLARRASSGTFIAGRTETPTAVQLLFDPRARRPGSFGAMLGQRLLRGLREAGISAVQSWAEPGWRFRARHLPVLWEAAEPLAQAAAGRRFAVLLQDVPPPGLGASYLDAVRTDDFSGGVCAAQLLRERLGPDRGLAVLAGPQGDRRIEQRVAGFVHVAHGAAVVYAGGWFTEDGARVAPTLLQGNPAGVFCCNDRLAEGLLGVCSREGRRPPAVIGFDNAPIAEALHLSTIAIPWDLFVRETVAIVRSRLSGDTSPARQVVLSLRPHLRLTT